MRKTLSAVIWVPLLLAGCGRDEGQKNAADAAAATPPAAQAAAPASDALPAADEAVPEFPAIPVIVCRTSPG